MTLCQWKAKNRDDGAYFVLGGGGGGANKQAPETLTCRGFREGNSPPENFEILKLRMLGNATFCFC